MVELIQAVTLFVKGVVIGFSIAAPVGPIGVLCIQKTYTKGVRAGLLTGAGAASADALYGFVGAFGLVFISHYLIEHQSTMHIVGGIYLCHLGVSIVFKRPSSKAAVVNSSMGAYFSTFFLTLTNPLTILMFVALFSGVGIGHFSENYILASLLVIGVFTGSLLWWTILSIVVATFRTRIMHASLQWVNRISGGTVFLFGLYALATF